MSEIVERHQSGISFLVRSGPGPTVLLLHGIGSNAWSFTEVLNALPAQLNVLAWNAPGYLSSEPLKEHWPIPEDYAQALGRFLDELGVKKVSILGHSLGTLMAAAYAQLFPERVEGLILASAANGYGVAAGGDMPEKVAARITELERLGPEAFARSRAANLVYSPTHHSEIVARVETAMEEVNPKGYAQAVRMLASGDLPNMLRTVSVRPAFIIGDQDKITPLSQTEAARQAWRSEHGDEPTLVTIRDAGHAVYVQNPTKFAKAVTELLALSGTKNTTGLEEPIGGN